MNEAKVALLVHGCDRYEFLFRGFEYFFAKYWDFNISCIYYFGTETKTADINGFQNIKSGKGEWSDRLRFLLKEKVPENYVLLFQEDMWLNKKVNPIFFQELFDITVKNKWKQVKLHSSGIYKTIPTPYFIEGFNISRLDNESSNYLMSHQVTLWENKFLQEQLYKNEHPWRNERRGTKRLKKLNPEIFHIDYFAENGNEAINNNRNPKERSEYQSISVNGVFNHNIKPYIEELSGANSGLNAYAKEIKFHYDNFLTHDGKAKPRKEDIFQKIKKKFRKS